MEKNRLDILSEIKESLESLKEQVAGLESRIAELEAGEAFGGVEDLPEDDADMSPIDINLDDEMDMGVEFPEQEAAVEVDAEPSGKVEDESVQQQDSPSPKQEDIQKIHEDSLPLGAEFNETKAESINDKQEKKGKKAVMDVLGTKCAWKTAMPGTPVKNIISAISLNDRVLFINTLFKEDAPAFQEAIAAFNGMSSLLEAEEYIQSNHPEWNLNSDIVYRLMMAIRRKLR